MWQMKDILLLCVQYCLCYVCHNANDKYTGIMCTILSVMYLCHVPNDRYTSVMYAIVSVFLYYVASYRYTVIICIETCAVLISCVKMADMLLSNHDVTVSAECYKRDISVIITIICLLIYMIILHRLLLEFRNKTGDG